jgi:hypothetical protein
MGHTCNPSCSGDKDRKIMVQGWLGKSMRTYLKNNPKQKGPGVWLKW